MKDTSTQTHLNLYSIYLRYEHIQRGLYLGNIRLTVIRAELLPFFVEI